jgi:hypothetical protein
VRHRAAVMRVMCAREVIGTQGQRLWCVRVSVSCKVISCRTKMRRHASASCGCPERAAGTRVKRGIGLSGSSPCRRVDDLRCCPRNEAAVGGASVRMDEGCECTVGTTCPSIHTDGVMSAYFGSTFEHGQHCSFMR